MARNRFGGNISDWTFATGDEVPVGELTGRVSVTVGDVPVTFWSAEVGGSQYDDLLDSDGEQTSVIVSSNGQDGRTLGQIPPFTGPDGVAEMWAQAGDGPRARIAAIGVTSLDANMTGSLTLDGTMSVSGEVTAGQATIAGDMTVAGSLAADSLILADPQQTQFSKSLLLVTPQVGSWPVWRVTRACSLTAVHAQRGGGTGAAVNVLVNGVKALDVDLALAVADSWTTGIPATPPALAPGDTLSMSVISQAGAPAHIAVQADLVVV